MVARSRELHGRRLHGLSNVCVRGETRSSEHSSTDEHHISALLELLPHRGTRSSCQTCREHQDSLWLVVSSTWCRLACMHSSGCAAAWNRALNGRLTCLLRADGDAPTQSTTRVRMGLKVFLVVATLPHRQSVRAADLHVFDQDRRLDGHDVQPAAPHSGLDHIHELRCRWCQRWRRCGRAIRRSAYFLKSG